MLALSSLEAGRNIAQMAVEADGFKDDDEEEIVDDDEENDCSNDEVKKIIGDGGEKDRSEMSTFL